MKKKPIYFIFLWTLVAVSAVIVSSCNKSSQEAPPTPNSSARIMLLQPSPYVHPVDLYSVYPDTVKLNGVPIGYPGTTTYLNAPSGVRYLFCFIGGTSASYPDFSLPLYFKPGGSYTLYSVDRYVNTQTGQNAIVEDDLSAPQAGYAKIRIIQGANYSDRLNWIIHGGDTLAKGLGYRNQYSDTTSFKQLMAGNYLFDLCDYSAPYAFKVSLQASVAAGRIYTVFTKLVPTDDTTKVTIGMQLITNK